MTELGAMDYNFIDCNQDKLFLSLASRGAPGVVHPGCGVVAEGAGGVDRGAKSDSASGARAL